jgi:hypothetical protein
VGADRRLKLRWPTRAPLLESHFDGLGYELIGEAIIEDPRLRV